MSSFTYVLLGLVGLAALTHAAPAEEVTPAAAPAPVDEDKTDLKASSTYGLGYGLGGYSHLGYAPKIVAPVGYGYGGYGYGGLGHLGYGGYGGYGKGYVVPSYSAGLGYGHGLGYGGLGYAGLGYGHGLGYGGHGYGFGLGYGGHGFGYPYYG